MSWVEAVKAMIMEGDIGHVLDVCLDGDATNSCAGAERRENIPLLICFMVSSSLVWKEKLRACDGAGGVAGAAGCTWWSLGQSLIFH